jgi:hypothetical protein
MPKRGTCALCGESGVKLTVEDVQPTWVREYAQRVSAGELFIGEAWGRPYSGPKPPAHRVKLICEPCNHWMGGEFEETTKPILVPLMEGAPQTLLPPNVRRLARWVNKSALMFALTTPQPPDEAIYRAFRRSGDPAPNCLISIGHVSSTGQLLVVNPSGAPRGPKPKPGHWLPEPVGPHKAWHLTIVIGHFVAQFVYLAPGEKFDTAARNFGFIVPIWPDAGIPVQWPPPRSITPDTAFVLGVWITS